MSLPKAYTNNYGKIASLLKTIRDGTAPETFNRAHLKDLGFTSSHDFATIQVLKALDFLSSDGKPTSRYMSYLDKSKYKRVLGEAVRSAYNDIFVLKANPSKSDTAMIEGKFKTEFNSSDKVAKARAATFFALLDECEIQSEDAQDKDKAEAEESADEETKDSPPPLPGSGQRDTTFHYNVQIHLPPSKDIEVYNAIFKSLKEHLID